MKYAILFAALVLVAAPARGADCANGQCAVRAKAATVRVVQAPVKAAKTVAKERPRLFARLRCR